jgi:aminomethyltransferase
LAAALPSSPRRPGVPPVTAAVDAPLRQLPLHGLHRRLGARMVPFAGFDMPLQYRGTLAEHRHAREKAVLFDVSHMGQVLISGGGEIDAAFERLVVGDIHEMPAGKLRYTLLTNAEGGIIDDLMVTHLGQSLALVVNASRTAAVIDHLRRHLPPAMTVELQADRVLLALQGPMAAAVLAKLAPPARFMLFMTCTQLTIGDVKCSVSRSGYTGEDGFEIAAAAADALHLAELLLGDPVVQPAGLGARDTLRLEAGLCLYGQDIDETTTPIEADLAWTIGRRRRVEGGFLGADVILEQVQRPPARCRAGIRLDGRVPARAGAVITNGDGQAVGRVTSGTFAPSLGAPVAMGYVDRSAAAPGTPVQLRVRDQAEPGRIVALPFVPHRFYRP